MSSPKYTAGDLAADWDLWYDSFIFRIRGGHAIYESANFAPNVDKVVLERLEPLGSGANITLKVIQRRVSPETQMELLPLEAYPSRLLL